MWAGRQKLKAAESAASEKGLPKGVKNHLGLAGKQGFEPRFRGPEPRVLPLDDFPKLETVTQDICKKRLCQLSMCGWVRNRLRDRESM